MLVIIEKKNNKNYYFSDFIRYYIITISILGLTLL